MIKVIRRQFGVGRIIKKCNIFCWGELSKITLEMVPWSEPNQNDWKVNEAMYFIYLFWKEKIIEENIALN